MLYISSGVYIFMTVCDGIHQGGLRREYKRCETTWQF